MHTFFLYSGIGMWGVLATIGLCWTINAMFERSDL